MAGPDGDWHISDASFLSLTECSFRFELHSALPSAGQMGGHQTT